MLKPMIEELIDDLVTRFGVTRADPADVRAACLKHLNETVIPEMFLDWIERCPEAREFLRQRGVPWDEPPAVTTGGGGDGAQFIVDRGRGPVRCAFNRAVGHMIEVRVIETPGDAKTGRLVMTTLSAVDPADRERVRKIWAAHPGSADSLVWG